MRLPPLRAIALALVAAGLAATASAQTAPSTAVSAEEKEKVEQLAASWAAELAKLCPVAAPGDQAAFDSCRQKVFRNRTLARTLPDHLIWGRQADPKATLRDSNLTQFAPDVWLGTYLPLFMFNGKHTIEWSPLERMFVVRLETAFRNRLAPGQFPYPFWHNEQKWSMYQNAKSLLLWVDPRSATLKAAQYTPAGRHRPLVAVALVDHKFDGKWVWTDASGVVQPQVTMFDGLFSDKNPYKSRLEGAYREFALQMRAAQCSSCHVPNNPFQMKRLVLLQTPAHAAGEIKRVLRSVRSDRMPLDERGIEMPLDPVIRKALLDSGTRFDKVVDAAHRWEAKHGMRAGTPR